MASLPGEPAFADVHPEAARAAAYALVARLFRAPPDQALLDRIARGAAAPHAWEAGGPAAPDPDAGLGIPTPGPGPAGSGFDLGSGLGHAPPGGEPPLEAAWRRLRAACQAVDEGAARDEFDELFSGLGAGTVSLYGAHHRPAAQMDRSRVALRQDLARLGLALRRSVREPEDHVSVLCEVMRWLIVAAPQRLPDAAAWQQRFFGRHLRPWHARLADALEQAEAANFYRVAGRFARALFEVEAEAFDLDDGDAPANALELHHDHA